MNKLEIKEFIKKELFNKYNNLNTFKIRSNGKWIKTNYEHHFNFIINSPGRTMVEKIYCIWNDIKELPKCLYCNQNIPSFNTFKNGFNKFCCTSCINKSSQHKDKIKETCLKKYGTEYAFQSNIVKDKIKQTNIERYGVKYPVQTQIIKDKIKQTYIERYKIENPSQSNIFKDKIKETCLKKYGTEYAFQSNIIKDKIKLTNLKKYGVKYPSQSNIIKNKVKETCLKKYGVKCVLQSPEIINKIKLTNLKKYGVENIFNSKIIRNKIKETCLKKYGHENPYGSKEIIDKIKQINLKKYGVKCVLQSPEIINKIKLTNLKKYGTKYPSQSNIIKNKIKETCLKKYGVEYVSQSKEIIKKSQITFKNNYWNKFNDLLKLKNIEYIGTKEQYINKNFNDLLNFHCLFCNKNFKSKNFTVQKINCSCQKWNSSQELEIKNWLKSLNINIIENSRNLIYPFEIDIYLPDFNLAIEFNGVYWHSELFKDKNYHLNKYNLCKEKNIQLIQIFENEWINKKEIVKSIILNKLNLNQNKIYARNTLIKEINNKDYKEFLEENHIQGQINSKIKLGLFYQDELVSVIGLSQSRFKKDEIEIIRYCNKLNTTIIGGFSKLIKYIIKNYQFEKLISYVDLRYFNGEGYINNGFKIIGQSQPNYFYINKQNLESRIKYQKHKLKNILKKFDKNLSEHENMLNNKIYRIYDVGNLKLQYEN